MRVIKSHNQSGFILFFIEALSDLDRIMIIVVIDTNIIWDQFSTDIKPLTLALHIFSITWENIFGSR